MRIKCKMKQKLLWGMCAITLIGNIMLTSACASPFIEEKDPNSIKIGLTISDEFDPFVSDIVKQMVAACKEKEAETGMTITVDVVSSGGRQLNQNNQVDEFAQKGYDAICVNLVDRTDPNMIIDMAKAADMPVIFFNRELVEEDLERWDKLYYVGGDAEESGRMQGELVVSACEKNFEHIDKNKDGKLQYLMIEGEAGHQDALIRTQESVDTIIENGIEVDKLDSVIANWNREQAATKVKSMLERYPGRIEVILANNDQMALGALDAYAASGITSTEELPLIVGVNGIEEAVEMVLAKKMEGTVYNDAIGQGRTMAEIAVAVARGEKIPDDIDVVNGKSVYLHYRKIDFFNAQQYQK